MFCPKCGGLLINKNGKVVCSNCGAEFTSGKIKEKTKKKEKSISIAKKETEIHPKTKAKCPKCGNNEAYYWVVQTRSADEPPTRFYKCTKCKYIWREYS